MSERINDSIISPLKQVSCEFYFNLNKDTPWDESKPGAIFSSVMEKYPLFEPIKGVIMQVDVPQQRGQSLSQKLLHSEKYKYTNSEHTKCIVIDKESFTFSETFNDENTYNRGKFQDNLDVIWKKIKSKCLNIDRITSIRLIHVNHIPVPNYELKTILNTEGKYISPILLDKSKLGFASRSQIASSTSRVISISTATFLDQKSKQQYLLLDIENVHKESIKPTKKEYSKIVNALHTEIEEVFFDTVSEDTKDILLANE